jgi:hypothetical protein
MNITPRIQRNRSLATLVIIALTLTGALAQSLPGIPEPGLTLYGDVRNTVDGDNLRLTVGTLVWTVQPATGNPITVQTPLRNINDQFSYAVRLPFETVPAGFTLSPNALQLSPTSTAYTRSATIEAVPASLVTPTQNSFTFSSAERGRLERVDLHVSLAIIDTDGDGIPDAWETQHGLDPNNPNDALLDTDGDGQNNLQEYLSGTDSTDPQSLFAIIQITADDTNGTLIEWSSVEGQLYTVERSTALETGFIIIAPDLPSTPPMNNILDTTATAPGPYFYRIRTN